MRVMELPKERWRLKCLIATLGITDANRFRDVKEEHLAIANSAASCAFHHRFNGGFSNPIREHCLQLDFGNEINRVFVSPVDLSMSLLASVATDFADRHALNADLVQCLTNGVQL